jgi:hypothetical protein
MVQELICDRLKLDVWCGLMCDNIFGPFMSVENNEQRHLHGDTRELPLSSVRRNDLTNSKVFQ